MCGKGSGQDTHEERWEGADAEKGVERRCFGRAKRRNEKHDARASASYRGREMHDRAHQPVCNQPGSSLAAGDTHSELEICWKGLQGKFYADAEKDVMTSRISSLGFTAPVRISY